MLIFMIITITGLQFCLANEYVEQDDATEYDVIVEDLPMRNLSDPNEVQRRRTFIQNCCCSVKCPGWNSLSDPFANADDTKIKENLRIGTKYSRTRIITLRPYRNLVFAVQGPTTPFKRHLIPWRLRKSTTGARRRRSTTAQGRRRRRRRTTTPAYYDDYYEDVTTTRRRRRTTTPSYYDDYYYENDITSRRTRSSTTAQPFTKQANAAEAEYYDDPITTRRKRRRTTTKMPEYYDDDKYYYDDMSTTKRRRTRSTASAVPNTTSSNTTVSSPESTTVIPTKSQDSERREETSNFMLLPLDTKKPVLDDTDP